MAPAAVLHQAPHLNYLDFPLETVLNRKYHQYENSQSRCILPDRPNHLLEVSPYTESEHLLDLSTLDVQNQLFAEALVELKPAVKEYATASYELCLNWDSVMDRLEQLVREKAIQWQAMDFYVVEFRSQLKPGIDQPLLFTLDKESHREATQSGGLLKYWYGSPDHHRRNLATCLWRSKEDAIKGGRGPWHKKAMSVIPEMYESISVKGLALQIESDISSWSFGPWQ